MLAVRPLAFSNQIRQTLFILVPGLSCAVVRTKWYASVAVHFTPSLSVTMRGREGTIGDGFLFRGELSIKENVYGVIADVRV
jgi:hypothetical protein